MTLRLPDPGALLLLMLGVALACAVILHGCPSPAPTPTVAEADSLAGRAAVLADQAADLVPDSVRSAIADSAYTAAAASVERDLARARAETDRLRARLTDLTRADGLPRQPRTEPPHRSDPPGAPPAPVPAGDDPPDVSADTLHQLLGDLADACDAERDACDRRDALRLGRISILTGERDSLRGAYDGVRLALGDMERAATLLQAAHASAARSAARARTQRDVALGVAAASGVALAACLTILDC